YLSVAAVALIIAVELHMFTHVRMNDGFAVLFVVVGTMATSGIWAVVRWLSDLYLGTTFLEDHDIVMWSFVAATAAGILGGIVFTFYFRRFVGVESRLPEGLMEVIGEDADR
ncbi:MAG: hypothetical protein SV377_00335, partial [Halobacteria archaeon]|nr:hypothetical protein [Halobacteria archaeon]